VVAGARFELTTFGL